VKRHGFESRREGFGYGGYPDADCKPCPDQGEDGSYTFRPWQHSLKGEEESGQQEECEDGLSKSEDEIGRRQLRQARPYGAENSYDGADELQTYDGLQRPDAFGFQKC
jgi:hypothetical protein